MLKTSITIDDRELRAALHRLADAAGDLTPVMTEIGETMRQSVTESFETGTDPFGTPWAPLKRRNGRPLVDTGTLKRSFVMQAMAGSAEVGTALEYAAIHQFGGKAGRNLAAVITARPFLPTTTLPNTWRQDIEGAITRHLRAALGD